MNWIATVYAPANRFQRTALWTLAITFFLIFVGGLVRAAGAGLGCPDWPLCFGLWIPPIRAESLPPGYDPTAFNALNTWLEFVNRLVGVAVGLFILATFVGACRFVRSDRSVFGGATAALVLVLYQGWLGGQVVQSGLEGWMISLHMVVALLILNVLLYTAYRSQRDRLRVSVPAALRRKALYVISGLVVISFVQIVLGSQIREALTHISNTYPQLARGEWIEAVGLLDMIHRSYSWLVLGGAIWFYRIVRPLEQAHAVKDLARLNNSVIVVQILMGAGLAYLGLPPVLQIFHLLLAALMISVQFLALLMLAHAKVAS